MKGDFLGVDLIAGLDEEQSRAEINKAIDRLSTKLDELKIDLDIDEKALQTIKDFNTEMRKLSQAAERTGQSVNQAMAPSISEDQRATRLRQVVAELQKVEAAQKKQGKSAKEEIDKESRALSEIISQYTHLNRIVDTKNEKGIITGQRYDLGDEYGRTTASVFTDTEGNVIRETIADNIEKENRRIEKLSDDQQRILRRLEKIQTDYGKNVDPKQMSLFRQDI